MLRAEVGFKIIGSIRPVTEAQEEPRLWAATLVRRIQQVCRQLLGSDYRADGIRNRHGFAAVYQPTDAWQDDLDENRRATISTPPVASMAQAARNWLFTRARSRQRMTSSAPTWPSAAQRLPPLLFYVP